MRVWNVLHAARWKYWTQKWWKNRHLRTIAQLCRTLDVYHTSTHGVALVRIYNAGLKCAARGSLQIQDAKADILAPSHNFVGLYLRNWGMYRQSEENLINSNTSSTCPDNMGELRPINGWDLLASLGHPCKFQRVSRLGSVSARHFSMGVSHTLRRWTEGATYIRQGGHHVGHWSTFLVFFPN